MFILSSSKLCGNCVAFIQIVLLVMNFGMYGTAYDIEEAPLIYEDTIFPSQPTYVQKNLSIYPGELCNRKCVSGDLRICYFDFNLEHYQAMGAACGRCAQGVEADCNNPKCIAADGVEKGVMSINRQIPGPPIHVCTNDLVVVDVRNLALGTAATIHWHGIHMQHSPHMDGVPFLTQCPIAFSNTFRYQFYATNPGTQFYHSHSGHHKANGQFGALIVRHPNEMNSYAKYDFDLPEHYIILTDWMHVYPEHHFPGLPSAAPLPNSVLINGRGLYTNRLTRAQTFAPPTVYYVKPGYRYRFRIINSGNHVCPLQVQIEGHGLTVISSDSFDVHPFATETLVTNSGERYDIIVSTNYTNGDFWIRVRGLGPCVANLIESFAVLRYRTTLTENNPLTRPFPIYEQTFPSNTYLNHPNAVCRSGDSSSCITDLNSVEQDFELQTSEPHRKFFFGFQNIPVPNSEVFANGEYNHFNNLGSNLTIMAAINRISLVFPSYPPLTQPEFIHPSHYCNLDNKPTNCADKTVCPCTHLVKVGLNSIVEFILVDEAPGGIISHPFHLHGYRFMVTGMGKDPAGIPITMNRAKEMDRAQSFQKPTTRARPPFKDTVSIPTQGYVVLRFRATNPGFWLMHCHYDWHFMNGMGLVLQVGETWQMVRPPYNFPKCGDYLPPVAA